MKNIFVLFLLVLSFSCKKKDDDNVTPTYVPKYATVRIELTAEKADATSNFTSDLKVFITSPQTYTSLSNKANSIIQEYNNIQDNKQIAIYGQSSICDVPMTINVYYDNKLYKSFNSLSTCTTQLAAGVRLPNYGK